MEDHIRDTMESAEIQAPEGVWENIQPQIKQPAGGGNNFFRSSLFKGVASLIIVGGAVAAFWMNRDSAQEETAPTNVKQETAEVQTSGQNNTVLSDEGYEQTITIKDIEQPAQKETITVSSSEETIEIPEGEGTNLPVVTPENDPAKETGEPENVASAESNGNGSGIVNDGVELNREAYMSLLDIYLSDTVVCKGNTVSVSVLNRTNLQFFESFHWEVNGKDMGSVLGLVYKCNAPGTIQVSLTAVKDGVEYSVARFIKVIELKGDIEAFRLPDRRSIQGLVKNHDLKTVTWYFGDNLGWQATQSATLNHTYQSLGIYPLVAVITNDQGCVDTARMMMNVLQDLTVPNIVTPGDPDGKNDVFEVDGMDITSYRLTIRDAHGNVVFESTDINEVWDARNMKNGERVLTGTYVISIRYTQGNSTPMEVKGTLVVVN